MIKEDLRVTEEELTLLKGEMAEYLLNKMTRPEEVWYCKQHMEEDNMLPNGAVCKTKFMREQKVEMNKWMKQHMGITPPYFLVASMLEEVYTFKINPCVYAALVNSMLLMSYDDFMKPYRESMNGRELTEENVTREMEYKKELVDLFVEEQRQMLLNAHNNKGIKAFLSLLETALHEYMDMVDARYERYVIIKKEQERIEEEKRKKEREIAIRRSFEEAKAKVPPKKSAVRDYTTGDCVRDCAFAVLDTLGELAFLNLIW